MKKYNKELLEKELNNYLEDDLNFINIKNDKPTFFWESVIVGFCLSSLTDLLGLTGVLVPIVTGGTFVAASSLTYLGLALFRNHVDNDFTRDTHYINQGILTILEARETDDKVGEFKAYFKFKIFEEERKQKVKLSDETRDALNQFLYLINSNYYYEISKKVPSLDRERLVNNLIVQTIYYLKNNNISLFDEKVAKKVLKNCYFIDDKLKKEIAKEFKKSKTKLAGKIYYRIIRSDMDIDKDLYIYEKKKLEDQNKHMRTFNIHELSDYNIMLSVQRRIEDYQKYGDVSEIEWDLVALKNIMVLISDKFGKKISSEREKNGYEYCDFDLVASFMHNVAVYCLLNNKKTASIHEMISAIHNWPFVNADLKLKILKEIKQTLNAIENPLPIEEVQEKEKKKIISFPKR